ncbi:hypothetical protein CLV44_12145 [Marinobacterium halophilum]|uniref:LPP20 lipoprotein n=2 Tax=Marinobacterium halophilum TaxID=267374 RepID=A0A2P8ER37_9GAMM|nr:hypothetical protein CLV44_12145 [Marinobacterium halophilum]
MEERQQVFHVAVPIQTVFFAKVAPLRTDTGFYNRLGTAISDVNKERVAMNNPLKLSAIAGLSLLISGCAHYTCSTCVPAYPAHQTTRIIQPVIAPQRAPQPIPQAYIAVDDIQVITVTGYGAPKSTFENLAQRRLMALRSSELDAYRKIAEQISGLHIVGDTRMDDFIANRDRLRAYVNSFVQGAAITRQEFEDDGMAVTTMSLKISRRQMQQMLEQERRWHASGGHLPAGAAYHDHGSYAPRY